MESVQAQVAMAVAVGGATAFAAWRYSKGAPAAPAAETEPLKDSEAPAAPAEDTTAEADAGDADATPPAALATPPTPAAPAAPPVDRQRIRVTLPLQGASLKAVQKMAATVGGAQREEPQLLICSVEIDRTKLPELEQLISEIGAKERPPLGGALSSRAGSLLAFGSSVIWLVESGAALAALGREVVNAARERGLLLLDAGLPSFVADLPQRESAEKSLAVRKTGVQCGWTASIVVTDSCDHKKSLCRTAKPKRVELSLGKLRMRAAS